MNKPTDIPLAWPEFDQQEQAALIEVLQSHRWSVGEQLLRFEAECAALAGCDHAVGVNSGTSGLQIALEALGIGTGDEVIVPAYTFVGSVNAILASGAEPVLVDVDRESLNLAPDSVRAALGPRVKAIMAVHLFGRLAAMDELNAIAEHAGLHVIEDACESAGAHRDGQTAGNLSDIGCYAFYPNKPIAAGEGGMLLLHDADLALRCRQLRNQGFDPISGSYLQDRHGHSARLSEWHAAIGTAQLRRLDRSLAQRDRVAAMYRERLATDERLELPCLAAGDERIAWFTFPLRLTQRLASQRDSLLAQLRSHGIGCNTYFTPVHHLPFHRDRHRQVDLSVSEDIGGRCLALPLHTELSAEQVDRICSALQSCLDRLDR
ncbi:DegT/DnrJ/EryC1/StrS family aminotransferase [Pseudomarimonas arenosa]|uniref:DegT/DnrJ/EryC1/StrS family aminotransferase n=1 Tax=Pseudomarimonas arenosa TaxID=2774145 RepID=A0AAW3ZK57_9GAMM|nr:DegT/DnrJ/EryC1/StrS family aminotransferase [Pseudomarimonas arenosa]MBD8526503.1 DegT/DnrJ/EryC1/StrS family aminotransferase [Pseudomarimonas arenosa]